MNAMVKDTWELNSTKSNTFLDLCMNNKNLFSIGLSPIMITQAIQAQIELIEGHQVDSGNWTFIELENGSFYLSLNSDSAEIRDDVSILACLNVFSELAYDLAGQWIEYFKGLLAFAKNHPRKERFNYFVDA